MLDTKQLQGENERLKEQNDKASKVSELNWLDDPSVYLTLFQHYVRRLFLYLLLQLFPYVLPAATSEALQGS